MNKQCLALFQLIAKPSINSYQAELQRQLTLFIVIMLLTNVFEVGKPRYTTSVCNNKAVLKWLKHNRMQLKLTSHKEADNLLLLTYHELCSHLNIKQKCKWDKGHQTACQCYLS